MEGGGGDLSSSGGTVRNYFGRQALSHEHCMAPVRQSDHDIQSTMTHVFEGMYQMPGRAYHSLKRIPFLSCPVLSCTLEGEENGIRESTSGTPCGRKRKEKKKKQRSLLQTLYAIIFYLRSTIKADHRPKYTDRDGSTATQR